MKILISGSSGLVGTSLRTHFLKKEDQVFCLVRKKENLSPDEIFWNPSAGQIDAARCEGFDVVIHLAGENIAGSRWTPARKQKIKDSRELGTSLLAKTLAGLKQKPKLLISASATGFYGNRGDEQLTEQSPAGSGFLPEVCQAWEQSTEVATQAGIRVVFLRLGIVLAPNGGALDKMLFPFKWGFGGVLGSGNQYWSWIALEDVIGMVDFIISQNSLEGPVNVVSVKPATNREFTKTLASVLKRPSFLPVPAFMAHLALGEMADELLLASTRVVPDKILKVGYQFLHENLKEYLQKVLI